MTDTYRVFLNRAVRVVFLVWAGLFGLGAAGRLSAESPSSKESQPIKGVLCNIDDSVFFMGDRGIAAGKAGEAIDHYVDVMAEAGASVLLCCSNARRTNYRSDVWDAYWDGYDPKGPDDQPFLAAVPREEVALIRQWIGNNLAVYQQGVDYPGRMISRCRRDGISPWITLRMNDCHYNNIPDHPFHGSFWKKNPQFARKNCPGYFATCLDYAHPEVRDFYMALVDESLNRYDVDGLELDFMRECFLFSAGKEAEGMPILTAWMRDVRKRVDAAAARRQHPIHLSVRVPSRPETAQALGFDVVNWAKEGVIDVLVPTPRWATLEFDMPLEQWRELLGTAKVTLAGGLEILYRPFPAGPAAPVSPELAKGAAMSVLSRGADAVYLFNYFQDADPHAKWSLPVYTSTLKTMGSFDALLNTARAVGITYRDITAPGEAYKAPLPAVGKELVLSMRTGPLPAGDCRATLTGEFVPQGQGPFSSPVATVNGKTCDLDRDETVGGGRRVISFRVPVDALAKDSAQQIKMVGKGADDNAVYRLERLEVSLTPGAKE
jgi:hypothetical protein